LDLREREREREREGNYIMRSFIIGTSPNIIRVIELKG
jgi:hypothetical protein